MDSQDKKFLEKLKRHPELRSRFDQILSIADNSGDELVTLADEAELLVIGQMVSDPGTTHFKLRVVLG